MIVEESGIEIHCFEDCHRSHLASLIDMRGIDREVLNDIPKIGVIAMSTKSKESIAIGFLRKVEGKYALLDSYISNPCMDKTIRDQALDLITDVLIGNAKMMGLIKIFAFTLDDNTAHRAVKHGFYRIPYQFTTLNLREVG